MTLNEFKKTNDYRDICYMIDHVSKLSVRLNVLKSLGYGIGFSVIKNNEGVKNVEKGKRGEFRVQVSYKLYNANLANCAIVQTKIEKINK